MNIEDSQYLSPGRRRINKKDLLRINLGQAFWGARTDLIQEQEVRDIVLRYRKNIVEMAKTGSGLLLSGNPGVGKTSVAACVIKEAVSAGLSSYFVTHAELKELRFEKKETLFGDGSDGISVRKKIDTAQLLVIDGFNEPFFTDNAFGPIQLEELLIRRSSNKLVTIMTTRSVATWKQENYSGLLDLVTQCMCSVPMMGKNMRDLVREKLQRRVLGGGEL